MASKPHGRPSAYTRELADEICERLSDGEPLTQICRDDHMPHRTTVHDWRAKDAEFSLRFAHAKDDGYDSIAGKLRQTARGQGESTKDVQRDKLIIDLDMKLLSKWDPKRYGDKLELEAKIQGTVEVVIGGNA